MRSFLAALRTLYLPYGKKTGARIVLDGVTGKIESTNDSNDKITIRDGLIEFLYRNGIDPAQIMSAAGTGNATALSFITPGAMPDGTKIEQRIVLEPRQITQSIVDIATSQALNRLAMHATGKTTANWHPIMGVGDAVNITESLPFTAETQVASLSLSNLKKGNRVWFSGFIMVKHSVATDNFVIRVRDTDLAGATLMLMRVSNQSTRYEHTSFGPQWWDVPADVPAGTNQTFALTVERWSGTGQIDQAGGSNEENVFMAQVELRD